MRGKRQHRFGDLPELESIYRLAPENIGSGGRTYLIHLFVHDALPLKEAYKTELNLRTMSKRSQADAEREEEIESRPQGHFVC